ncbi:MAG TPA: PKD domain-containing protein, partial [Vicinamibacteria bacterium]|nr:PKD domain-containing protein [Vicinamibacteria bacterium]
AGFFGQPWQFTPSGKYLYFTAQHPVFGPVLWRTDGTEQGTQNMIDIAVGPVAFNPSHLVDFNGVLLYVGISDFVGEELWRTDGTPQGTYMLRDIRPEPYRGSDITEIAVVGERAYFAADDGLNGKELWSTDGTEQGTQLWQPEVQPGPGSSSPTGLTAVGGQLFFAADDGFLGRELWKLDPAWFAPQRVADVNPGNAGSNPTQLRAAEGQVFFLADDGQTGVEPWVSDGTNQIFSTLRLRDITPGPQSSSPEALTNVNGGLFFRADNALDGAEPWSWFHLQQSGDFMLHWDVRFGPQPSGPAQFTLAGDRLFFTATDGFRGDELWTFDNRLPVAQAGADQVVEPGATVMLNGFESTDPDDPNFPLLSCEWRDFDGRVLGRAFCAVQVPDFQPGATEYTLIVRDGLGGRSEDTVKVSTPGRTMPVVTLVTPAAGETLIVGMPTEIQWTVEDPESIVQSRVLLSTDNGTSYVPVCTGGPGPTGNCTWTPPTYLEHARLRVEVHDESGDRGARTVTIDVLGQLSGPQRLEITVVGIDGAIGGVQASDFDFCYNSPGQPEVTCSFMREPGQEVTLRALTDPFTSSVFAGWSGRCTGTGDCTVAMNGSRRVTATFRPAQMVDFTVTVDSLDTGYGEVYVFASDGSTQFCAAIPGSTQTCTFPYLEGTTLDLQQLAAPGTTFVGWAGDCTGDGPCAVTMDQPRQVAATFRGTPTFELTVTLTGTDGGFGLVEAAGSDGSFFYCEGAPDETRTCTFPFPEGTEVHLSAMWPEDQATFLGWAGDCTGNGPCAVVMDQARQVAATFQGLPYANLYVSVDSIQFGVGRVDVIGSDGSHNTCQGAPNVSQFCTFPYPKGTTVTLQPTPASDSVFRGWFLDCAGTGACQLTMNSPKYGFAEFRGPQTLGVFMLSVNGGSGRAQLDGGLGFCDGTPNNTAFCPFNVPPGTTVSLSAQPHPHGQFAGWSGACSGTGACQVTAPVSPAVTVFAAFRFINQPPVAHPGGPYTGVRNQPIQFNGSGSSDPDGDALTYAWDFGDGTQGTGVAPSHAYATLGTFTVRLTVNDGRTTSAAATTSVTINSAPPVANAGGPYGGVRNQAITFDGSGSSDPDGAPLTYSWDFGDGAVGTGIAPTHAYSSLGVFTVRLTVSNGQATSAPALTTATINNVPPVANAGGPYAGVRNQAIAFNGSASSDPDGDPLTYSWNFGDGSQGSGVAPTHAYPALGTFTVTLTVSDGHDTSAPATTTVTITNVPPVANAGPDRTVRKNTFVVLDGRASTDSDGSIADYDWRQVAGPAVNLLGDHLPVAAFTAPNVHN